jgi:PAS domain-containing protein
MSQAIQLLGTSASSLGVEFLLMFAACGITLIAASALQRKRDRERQEIERQLSLVDRIRDLNLRVVAEAIPQIVWRKRADGTIDYFNSAWYEYSGLTPEMSLDKGFYAAMHPEDVARAQSAWAEASSAGSL